jgi:hypothetical protein
VPQQNAASSAVGAPLFNPAGQTQLMIAVMFLVMQNLRGLSRRLCAAMQYEILFIFQKGLSAAIEYRV